MPDLSEQYPSEFAKNPHHDEFRDLRERLLNWKFRSAGREAEHVKSKLSTGEFFLIKALARSFGDCGWMDSDSDMSIIISAALSTLVKDT